MKYINKSELETWKLEKINLPGISRVYKKDINSDYSLILIVWNVPESTFFTIDLYKDGQLYRSIDLDDYEL